MPGSSPSVPLALLNPGEFIMNPANSAGPAPGQNMNFSGQVAAVASGALAAVGYGTVASGLVASGSTIANALPLTAQSNHFATVATGTGTQLPLPANVPYPIPVFNSGAQALSVYPPTLSGSIGNGASGVAYVMGTGVTTIFNWFGGNIYGHTP